MPRSGGGISAFQSSFKLAGHNTFESNKAAEGGGFYAFDCTVNFPGETDRMLADRLLLYVQE